MRMHPCCIVIARFCLDDGGPNICSITHETYCYRLALNQERIENFVMFLNIHNTQSCRQDDFGLRIDLQRNRLVVVSLEAFCCNDDISLDHTAREDCDIVCLRLCID